MLTLPDRIAIVERVQRRREHHACPDCGEPLDFEPAHHVDTGTHGMPGLHTRRVDACRSCPECPYIENMRGERISPEPVQK